MYLKKYIFHYLDTIVINHNKILERVGLNDENKYNCFVLFCFVDTFISFPRQRLRAGLLIES